MKQLLLVILLNFIFLSLSYAQNNNSFKIKKGFWNGHEIEYINGQIAIKLKENIYKNALHNLCSNLNLTIKSDVDIIHWALVECPNGLNIFNFINRIKTNPIIEAVEPNVVFRSRTLPNDPLFSYQWPLYNYQQPPTYGAPDADIDATEAWSISTGNSNLKIAVLDSGIPLDSITLTLSHTDLDASNKFFIGPDFWGDGESVRDRNGHGTHVLTSNVFLKR